MGLLKSASALADLFHHFQQRSRGAHQLAGQGTDAGLNLGQFELPGFLALAGVGHDPHEFLLFILQLLLQILDELHQALHFFGQFVARCFILGAACLIGLDEGGKCAAQR